MAERENVDGPTPPRSTLYMWQKEAREERDKCKGAPGDFEPSEGSDRGRAKKLPPSFRSYVMDELDRAADANESPLRGALTAFVERCAEARRITASKSVFGRFIKTLDVTVRRPDYTTGPRIDAERDSRNYLSLAVSLETLAKNKDPRFLFNFDASVLQTGSENDNVRRAGTVVTKRWVEEQKLRHLSDSSSRVGIKMFCGGNAAGDRLRSVAIVDDGDAARGPRMKACEAAPGNGMLLVTPTRNHEAVGPMVVRHFIEDVVEYLKTHPLPENEHAIIYFDGAQENIGCVMDADVLDLCEANRIVLVKLMASMTHESQPFDRSNVFRGSKQKHAELVSKERLRKRTHAEDYPHHASAMDDALSLVGTSLSGAKRQVVIAALVRARLAFGAALTEYNVMEGFRKAGFFPYSRDAILAKAYDLEPSMRAMDMDATVEELVCIMREHGFVLEAEYDRLGVPKTDKQAAIEASASRLDLNDRALRSQRCVHLNVDGYLRYMREKAAADERAKREAAAARAEKRAAAERRAADKERKRMQDAAKKRRQSAFDADMASTSGTRCSGCGAARDRAASFGFPSVSGWLQCRHCDAAFCARCKGILGTRIFNLHKKRCQVPAEDPSKRPAPAARPRNSKRARKSQKS